MSASQAFELPKAEASSLGSLVDFAIDTDNGVVEALDVEGFYVVHDGYLYEYRPPVLGEDERTDLSVDDEGSVTVDFEKVRSDDRERDEDCDVPSGIASEGAED